METAKAPFEQINSDGSRSTGTFYIKRPGRMRFEYDPPETTLVVASAGALLSFDKKSNQPPETYPLRHTPLSLILARRVNLGHANMIVAHATDGKMTYVAAQDPDHPEYGQLQMGFSEASTELRNWTIDDGAGSRTRINLGRFEMGIDLSNSLFDRSLMFPRVDR